MEFKIEGMTCATCAQTIESAIVKEFKDKGLISVNVAVMTHKMKLKFSSRIDPARIIEEIEAIGFGCELIQVVSGA